MGLFVKPSEGGVPEWNWPTAPDGQSSNKQSATTPPNTLTAYAITSIGGQVSSHRAATANGLFENTRVCVGRAVLVPTTMTAT